MNAASLDRALLARILGLLGSSHDGEVIAAARQAERLRADAGLTWADIVTPRLPAPKRQNVGSASAAVGFVLQHADLLTEWEFNFARSVQRLKYPLSAKQVEVLERLVDKVNRTEARAA